MSMSPTALKAMLEAEKGNSLGVNAGRLSEDRAKAMDYYLGDMKDDMPSQEGRSEAVSSDVADTVEGLMPSLMEIFAAGEEVVRFEPVGEEDEQAALQETDYVNHVFMQKNPGFLILYSFIKDALQSKVGVTKAYWEKGQREERETYLDQADDTFAALAAQPDVEIVEHKEHEGEDGAKLHDLTLVKRKNYGCARVVNVPPEEFGISRSARSVSDATYCYHERRDRTQADLIAEGYDPDQVKELPTASIKNDEEQLARDTVEDGQSSDADNINRAARPIVITEHYCLMDYEDDGKPSLFRVTTGGDDMQVMRRNKKLDVERVDCMPFAAMTPIIMTHRFFGRSVADLVMDIQRIKTALIRGMLDNVYLANNGRVEVAEEFAHERTLDDLLVNRPGGVVRTKRPGGIIPIPNQPIGNFVFPAIEYMDATKENRTGVQRQGQPLDAQALQNETATKANLVFTSAQAKMKLIARIFAETGIRDLFSLLHGIIRKNDRETNTVRLRNKWVQVDPRNWKTREDMTVNVGLGDGSKAEQVQMLMLVLGLQKEAIARPELGLATPTNLYNTAAKLVEKIGLKSVQPFFTDPATNPSAGQVPPDPKAEEAKGKLMLEQQKAQAQIQSDAARMQSDQQMGMAKIEMEAQLKREQMVAEFQLKREQMDAEIQLKREEMMIKAQMGAFAPPSPAPGGIDGVRMGGEVG